MSVCMCDLCINVCEQRVKQSRDAFVFVFVKAKWTENKRFVWVDEAHQVVYFMGRKDGPLESHLYCASLRGDADATGKRRCLDIFSCFSISISAIVSLCFVILQSQYASLRPGLITNASSVVTDRTL